MSWLQKLKSFGLIGSYVVVSFANFIANSFTARVLSRFWNMSNMVASRDDDAHIHEGSNNYSGTPV